MQNKEKLKTMGLGTKVVTMHLKDIRAELKKAYSENLVLQYKLFSKKQRTERILLEIAKDYFVVSQSLQAEDVSVVFLDTVQELIAIPADKDFLGRSAKGWKTKIQYFQENYKRPEIQMQVQEQLAAWKARTLPMMLIERLEISAEFSKDPERFVGLLEKLKELL